MYSKLEKCKDHATNQQPHPPPISPRESSNYPLGAKPHLCKKHYDEYEESMKMNGRPQQQNVATYPPESFVRMDTFSSKKYKHVCHGCHRTFTYYKSLHSLPMTDPIYSNIPPPNCKHSKPLNNAVFLPHDEENNGYTPMRPRTAPGSVLFEPEYKRHTKEGTLQLDIPASRFDPILEGAKDIPPAKDQLQVIIGLLKDIKEKESSKYVLTRSRSQGWIADRDVLDKTPIRAHRVHYWDEIYKKKAEGKPSSSRRSRDMGDSGPSSSYQAPPSPVSDDSETCTCTWLEALNSLNKFVKEVQADNAKMIQNQFKKLSMYMQAKEPKASSSNDAQKSAKRHKKHGYEKLENTL